MTLSDAIDIVTWLDEPELLQEPGEPTPAFTTAQVLMARALCGAQMVDPT
jgi:hypothetical protein